MLKFRNVLALAGVGAACLYFWPRNEGPLVRLITGPTSVSYDAQAARLTAIVNIQNSGDRSAIVSITNDVFVDSHKQALNDRARPQPLRIELMPKQARPVIFTLQGERAAAVWNGVQLMEVTINAGYAGNPKLSCTFSFMGRFYPEIKQIGTVSSVTSPRQCR